MLTDARKSHTTWGYVNRYFLKRIRSYIKDRIIDVGCARGNYTKTLLQEKKQVFGCDLFSWESWQGENKDRFLQANALVLPFASKSFDTVLCLNVLEHIQPIDQALQELRRVCRGKIILAVPNCQQFYEMEWAGLTFNHWVDRSHVHYFQLDTFRELLLQAGFTIELLETFGTVRPEILVLKSLGTPMVVARSMAWCLNLIPWRKQYAPLILAIVQV